ncbi:MAG: DUF4215 domain-containing protein [Deltaproteobacteria bacterium]|nr:DUF4215 domain-containing protein [Deltaproteobacteria bacterium]
MKQTLITTITAALLLLTGTPVWAATWTVAKNDAACSNATGTPYCSIQAAVTNAANGDTITIAAGVYTENIVATEKGLILQGADADTTIIDGNLLGRVLFFNSAVSRDVEIDNLTIREGRQTNGAGLFLNLGNVTINNSKIENNEATAGSGGGLSLPNGSLTITNTEFSYNKTLTSAGGAFYFGNGTVTIAQTLFHDNQAKLAGCFYHASGTLSLTDTTLDNNSALDSHGCMYHGTGDLTLDVVSLTNNSAGAFGAFFNGTGIVTISNTVIEANQAASGNFGGFYHTGNTLTISGTTISHNTAALGYGGFYSGSGAVTFTSSHVDFNTATGGIIGGFYHGGTGLTISDSSVDHNVAHQFGGFYSNAGTLSIVNSSVRHNTVSVSDFGGFYKGTDATVITRSTISNNTAAGNFGGMLLSGTSATIQDSTISGNTAGNDFAGLFSNTPLELINSTISGNVAGRNGGGFVSGANTELSNVTVVDNVADADNNGTGNGGGIFSAAGTVTLRNSIVARNVDEGGESADCFGVVASDGFNILGNIDGCAFTASVDDLGGTTVAPVDPLLDVLAGNGGTTQTHALLAGSPALDAGNPAGCADAASTVLGTDQRGFARTVDGDGDGLAICDVGAYEVGHCGDGYVDEGEACDDGNGTETDTCTNVCQQAACGDGIVETDVETCDDGNTTDGDGCSAVCSVEPPAEAQEAETSQSDAAQSDDSLSDQEEDGTPPGANASTGGGGCQLRVTRPAQATMAPIDPTHTKDLVLGIPLRMENAL